jgi:polyadenylate-binding protein 2|uniref:RRM domain-containing protein n=1 Tax=Globisporangium ultimum (strain ATCC 200006 / CBS 805.95 / DAOM BR144) TaxID=431595 RepID=K3WFM6_GLOUD
MAEASNVDLEQLEAEAAQMEEPAPASSAVDATAAPAAASTDADSVAAVDAEIEDMKRRVKEMEEEAAKLSEMQSQVETQMGKNTASSLSEMHAGGAGGAAAAAAAQQVMDDNSIYIGQVDYGSTPEELQALFQSCGTINRVTILCDKFTGQPKGYAYIEFASRDAVESAILLNDTMFRGRQLKVTPKRQNVRGYNFSRGGRGGGRGGRGGRGRGRGRGPMRGGFRGGRGGGGRGFHPYF